MESGPHQNLTSPPSASLRWRVSARLCLLPLLWLGAACGPADFTGVGDRDLGPIDATLTDGERVNWPGVERGGGRQIPLILGFANGHPSSYWFLGFASKRSADSFWFCREGDASCPLDEHRRLDWDHLVGHPLFMRIPGQDGFSPFWTMWVVRVPADYQADSVKTLETLQRLDLDGAVTVEPFVLDFGDVFGVYRGPQEVLLHCALVLAGTELAHNGERVPGGTGPMRVLQRRSGWFFGHSVSFIDFSPSDGVFPESEDSESRSRMPFGNIYIQWRSCNADPRPPICDIPGNPNSEFRPVSERGLGQDITGDGDPDDTNNVISGTPCREDRPGELPYSPLWRVNALYVQPGAGLSLMDTFGDQERSDIQGSNDMFDAVEAGRLSAPVLQSEDSTSNQVSGNEGQLFFNCPVPVPQDFVPYPCSDNH